MEFSTAEHFIGASAAILSALCWAVSALLFAQISQSISAISLNLVKGLVAIVCLSLITFPIILSVITTNQWLFLALSGLLGIAIGDTLYFVTLRQLGARLTLLMSTLIPVVTASIAVFLFSENLGVTAALGLALTIGSVFYVMWSKAERTDKAKNIPFGLSLGMLFITTESSAILLTKAAVLEMDSVLVTFIRQVIGVAGLVFWMMATRTFVENTKPLTALKTKKWRLIGASIIGGVLGTWLSVYALKMTYASVAVVLNSVSPLFIIPLSMWILKEDVPRSSQIGAFIAVFGIVIYFLQINT